MLLARRIDPDSSEVAFNLGLGLAQAGELQDAASELEAAVSMGYERPQIHEVLSRIYHMLGDAERSAKERAILERMERNPPRD